MFTFKEELEEAENEPLALPDLTADEDDEDNSNLCEHYDFIFCLILPVLLAFASHDS